MLFKKLNMLAESDFAFFRIPFISKRQSPTNIKKALYLGVFLQVFLGSVFYFLLTEPIKDPGLMVNIILAISLTVTVILIIVSLIYVVPKVYKKKQAIQYLVANLMFFNVFGFSLYTIGLFFIQLQIESTRKGFTIFFVVSSILLIIFMVTILIRLFYTLRKGEYREDSSKHNHIKALETDKKKLSRLSEFAIAVIGIVFIVQFILNNLVATDFRTIFLILLLFLLPYLSLYMFAHSLITYYCKRRFSSFNFDEDGNLQPWGSGDKVRDQKRA